MEIKKASDDVEVSGKDSEKTAGGITDETGKQNTTYTPAWTMPGEEK